MNALPRLLFLASLAGAWTLGQSTAHAQPVIDYDNTSTSHFFGYGDNYANNPIFGGALHLAQGGTFSTITFSVFNNSQVTSQAIQAGTMHINFYDNSPAGGGPYTGGSLTSTLNLIFSFDVPVSFAGSGIIGDSAAYPISGDFSSANITLPQDIFVTQHFTQTSGTSTGAGAATAFASTVAGSFSPNNQLYANSPPLFPEGLYTEPTGGSRDSNFTYAISVIPVPEPSSLALLFAPAVTLIIRRRRAKSATPSPATCHHVRPGTTRGLGGASRPVARRFARLSE